MRRSLLLLLLVLVASLSGCFGKDDLSPAEMESRAAAALIALEDDIGPGGRVRAFDMLGSVTIEAPTPAGVFPVSVQASATVAFGTDADVRIDGKVAKVTYTVYCDPQHLVVVTDGFENYGERDEDLEMRNHAGTCTGSPAEPLLGGLGDLDFADPALLTGHFDPDALTLVGVEKTEGKNTFDAVYQSTGVSGATDITVHMKGRDVQSFTVENPESRLTLTPDYGERVDLTVPTASDRFPGPVRGSGDADTTGYEYHVTSGSGGAVDDYRVLVHGGDLQGCAKRPDTKADFALADGDVQEENGYRFTFQDDGDDLLGPGDWFLVQHPERGSAAFTDEVTLWDDWAGAATTTSCSIPGPGAGLGLLGVLGALAVALRRS